MMRRCAFLHFGIPRFRGIPRILGLTLTSDEGYPQS